MLGGAHKKQRCYHDFAREFVIVVQTFDQHLRNNVDDGVYYEICDDTFDAQVQEEEKKKPKMMMPQFCCIKSKGIFHLDTKSSRHGTIVMNRATS